MFIGAPFRVAVQQDAKDSREQILAVSQGGLGLPDRGYYLKTDSASVATRTAYAAHLARELRLSGQDSAAAQSAADRVMALETTLARDSRPPAERRDPLSTYHRMPVAEAQSLAPHLELAAWLTDMGVANAQALNVADPDFFRGLDSLFTTVPVADWREYLRLRYLDVRRTAPRFAIRKRGFPDGARAEWCDGEPSALESVRRGIGPGDGRSARAGVRGTHLFTGGQGTGTGDGAQHGGGPSG